MDRSVTCKAVLYTPPNVPFRLPFLAIRSAYNPHMASGQDYSKHQHGIINRYYEHIDTIALQKLSEIVSDLYLAEGGSATKLWNSARQALAKLAPADDPRVKNVLSVRSPAGLAKLVTELTASAKSAANAPRKAADDLDGEIEGSPVIGERAERLAPPTPPTLPTPAATTSDTTSSATDASATPTPAVAAPTPEQLKNAMKAFRKRLKLTILDDESKLGRVGNPMSGGKKSQVLAIMPPREYPKHIWDELVKQGKLRASGGSFYELVES